MVGRVYYKGKKWNRMHFSRVESKLANRAPCFLWFLALIFRDKERAALTAFSVCTDGHLPRWTVAGSHCFWVKADPTRDHKVSPLQGELPSLHSCRGKPHRGKARGDLRERRARVGWQSPGTFLHFSSLWGKETNSVNSHGLVSFLLHSLLTFPSLHLSNIKIINK